MDRLEAMAILAEVAEAGSLTAAARRLGQPLPSVSRKLAEFEARLGAKLLIRTTRRLALTEAGETFVAASRRILDEVEEAERAASGEYRAPRGDLVVAAPVVFGRLHVTPVVAEFLAGFPQIRVRLRLGDRNADLIEERIDVALRIGALPDSALLATRIGEVRRVVCASPGYLAANGEPRTPEDLVTRDCVTFDQLPSAGLWSFGRDERRQIAPRTRLVVNTAEAALDAAMLGVGLTRLLSYQAAGAVATGRLRLVLTEFEPAPSPVHLIYEARGPVPLKLRSFLDFAAPRLRARLSEAQAAFLS